MNLFDLFGIDKQRQQRINDTIGNILTGVSDKYFGTNYQATEAADVAWQRQLELLNMTNQYNSPAAQMQRARAAGLNPSLIYGQPISESQQPTINPASQGRGSGNPIQDILGVRLLDAQIRDLNAAASLKESQSRTEDSLRDSRLRNLDAVTENLFKQNADIVSKIEQRVKQNALTEAQIDMLSFEKQFKQGSLDIDKQRLKNETRITDSEIDKLIAEKSKILAEAKVSEREYSEMIWTFAIRKSGLEKQVNLTQAQIEQANATARKLGIEGDLHAGDAAFERKLTKEAFEEHSISSLALYGVQRAIGMFGHVLKL